MVSRATHFSQKANFNFFSFVRSFFLAGSRMQSMESEVKTAAAASNNNNVVVK
jgi:hypothetical protein